VAKKVKKNNPKKNISPEDLKHARAIAAGLEASFTEPAPPGAMAPAPLLDEIREMGGAGIAGMLEHLASVPPEGRVASLRSFRELGDAAAVPGLLERVRGLRWTPDGLMALGETVRALDPGAELPAELDGEAIGRARKIAGELAADDLSTEAAASVSEIFESLPARLQAVAFRDVFSAEGGDADKGRRTRAMLTLAEAFSSRGAAPPVGLIDGLASLATADAAEALAHLADSVTEKGAGSRIRKALYRLRGKGVVPNSKEAAGTERKSVQAGPQGPDFVRTIISSVDGSGNLMLWLARSRQPRGRSLFQARIRHGRGIEEFVSTDVSSKELREFFGKLTQDSRVPTAEVPAGYAFWLLQRGQQENENEGGAALPPGFTHSNLLLAPLADPEGFPFPGGHPVRREIEPISEGGERIETKEMFANPVFWSWVLEEGLLLSHFQKCVDALQSQVAVDDEQRRGLFDKAVEDAAGELYENADLRRRLGLQLEDNAYLFHCNGETGHARECLTLADELKEGGPRPEFFTEVVRYSISIMLDRAIRQSQEAHAREGGHDHDHDHGEAASQGGSEEESPVIISP
jgi:hypothetical protein